MIFFSSFTKEVIATGVIIAFALFLSIVIAKFIRRYAKLTSIIENRTNLVIKYIQANHQINNNIFLTIM
jgi:hypothetical protein